MAVYFSSRKEMVKGNRNSRSPVILFMTVWMERNVHLETYSQMILPILIIAMAPPQIHSHCGIRIAGSSLYKAAAVKARSAIVSNRLPNRLSEFVFLATVPSIISLNPQRRYRI